MIDFFKISGTSEDFANKLRSNPSLMHTYTINKHLNDSVTDKFAFRGLEISINSKNHIKIKGSLHKFSNGGRHNHNDFSIDDVNRSINELIRLFGDELNDLTVNHLEIGVNLKINSPANNYLDSVIVFDSNGIKEKVPITRNDAKGFEKGFRFNLSQYELKYYDKSQMYIDAPANILRVELKVKRMVFIKKTGIEIFADLCSKDKLIKLSAILQETHSKCVYEEELLLNNVPLSVIIEHKNLTDPKYIKKEINSPYKRTLWLNKLHYLHNKYGITNKKKDIEGLIHQKISQLS